MRSAHVARWPTHARGRCAAACLAILVLLCGQVSIERAAADPPQRVFAVFRDRVGWHCPHTVSRLQADFTGDGVEERVVFWDPAHRGERCDTIKPAEDWRLSVVFRSGQRIDRPVPCFLSAAKPCWVRAADYDRDHVSELELVLEQEVTSIIVRPYQFVDNELRRIRIRSSSPGLSTDPIDLVWGFATTYQSGWACRDHRDGVRVMLRYISRWHQRTARWRVRLMRVRYERSAIHVNGTRSFVRSGKLGRPPSIPNTRACRARST